MIVSIRCIQWILWFIEHDFMILLTQESSLDYITVRLERFTYFRVN